MGNFVCHKKYQYNQEDDCECEEHFPGDDPKGNFFSDGLCFSNEKLGFSCEFAKHRAIFPFNDWFGDSGRLEFAEYFFDFGLGGVAVVNIDDDVRANYGVSFVLEFEFKILFVVE